MAQINQYVDFALNRQSLIAAKVYPLTSAARTALTLVSADAGLLVYDITLNSLQAWNGTAWQNANPTGAGGMAFKGTIAASAAVPSAPVAGDMYVFSSAGTTSWPQSAVVVVGDAVVYDGAAWNYLEKNASTSSSTVEGIIRLATQAEADAGVNASTAVTPASLATLAPTSANTYRIVRRFKTVVNLVANTALTITHNLALANAAECDVTVTQGGSNITVGVNPVDANSLTIISHLALSTVTVVVMG